ncbi:MAG: hypothetical protein KAI83_18840 [Thiomargarita sp.]|nr:hypothetical protein [Thiomargarita sp.]
MCIELSVLKEALQKRSHLEKLEQIVKDFLVKGYSKESILAEFEDFRETTTDEDYEDVVLEVMDFLVGWCSSHKRIDAPNAATLTDDNELTYFIIHQLEVIEKAIEQFHYYLEQKHFNLQEAEQLLRNTRIVGKLNHRQLALLKQVLKNSHLMSSF